MATPQYEFIEVDLPEELLEWRRDLIATSTKWTELNIKLDAYCGDPASRVDIERQLKEVKIKLQELERRLY